MVEMLTLYNPTIHDGDFVVSQYLDDENQGFPLDRYHTGVYQLSIEGPEAVLYNVYGIDELRVELDDFIKTGELGEERFTVVHLSDPVNPVTKEDVLRQVKRPGILVEKSERE